MRTAGEDVSVQRAAFEAACEKAACTLEDLAADATAAAKAARARARSQARAAGLDLNDVHAAYRAVARAEEQVDIAALDVHTAAGGDA